jgi:hypothetical protein
MAQDILVQQVNSSIGNSGGTDTTFTAVGSLGSTIELPANNRRTHAGATTLSSSNLEGDDLAGARLLTSTSTLTYYRESASLASSMEFQTFLWEYTGAASGANEFKVTRFEVDLNGTTASANVDITSAGVTTAADCIPIITGIMNNATTDDTDSATSTAYLTSTTNMVVNKGSASNNVKVYISLVEFTGSAWNVLHGRSTANNADTGSIDLYDGSDGTGSTATVTAWANSLIFGQYRSNTADGTDDAIADNWPLYKRGTTGQVDWEFNANHASVSATEEHVVHVLEHADMDVTIFTNTSNTAGETTIDITSAGLTSLDQALIVGSSISSGGGTAVPRGYRNYYFNSTTQAAHWCTRSGNTMSHYLQVVDLIGLVSSSPDAEVTATSGSIQITPTNATVDTTATPDVIMSAGAGTDGDTTSRLTGMTGTFTAGKFTETVNPNATATDIVADGHSEFVFSVEFTHVATDASDYEFRLVLGDGTLLDTYTNTPTVTVGSGGDANVTATTNSIQITPTNATVIADVDLDVTATTGSINITPTNATVVTDIDTLVTATTSTINVTPTNATVLTEVDAIVDATTASINITPTNATVVAQSDLDVTATTASINITPTNVTLNLGADAIVEATTSSIQITPTNAVVSLGADANVTATSASIEITPTNATVTTGASANVTATTNSIQITPTNATVTTEQDVEVTATTNSIVITPTNATILAGTDTEVTATTASIQITPTNATVTTEFDAIVVATTSSIQITPTNATVLTEVDAIVDATGASIEVSATNPTLELGRTVIVTATSASLTITPTNATVVAFRWDAIDGGDGNWSDQGDDTTIWSDIDDTIKTWSSESDDTTIWTEIPDTDNDWS